MEVARRPHPGAGHGASWHLARPSSGDALNIEIERSTQGFVSTVLRTLEARLGPLLPALEAFGHKRGIVVEPRAA